MGSASGRFFPLPAYAAIEKQCSIPIGGTVPKLPLSIRTADGALIPAQQGVSVVDHRAAVGTEEAIQVHVDGVPYPLYEQLFPSHVAAYRKLGQSAG
jgi:hypothetical protein